MCSEWSAPVCCYFRDGMDACNRLATGKGDWQSMVMGGAISISADNSSNLPIRRLWKEVSSFEDEPSMEQLCYRPHFTLAIYESIDIALLETVVRSITEGQTSLRIVFDGISFFDVSPMVLWASPQDNCELLEMHSEIHSIIDPALCREHYRPGSWIPHCTLGTRIQDEERENARASASNAIQPFEVVFDTVDWVCFPPVEVVGCRRLITTPAQGQDPCLEYRQ